MAQTYLKWILDVNEPTPVLATAVQRDVQSRYLDVTLVDAGVPIDLTGNEVKIFGKKPDGKEIYNNGTVTNAVKGQCRFELTEQTLAAVGTLKMQIEIWKIGKGVTKPEVLKNIPFTIEVITKLRVDKNLESTNEYGSLTNLFHYIQEYFQNIDTLINKMADLEGKIEDLKQTTGIIKSVQRGNVAPKNDGTGDIEKAYRDITISLVDINKSILIIDSSGTLYSEWDEVEPYLYNSTTIRQYSHTGGWNGSFPGFKYQVVEFY
ncbi:MAG TPA: BppU family phage baseplate upper protein [Candidatus Coprocola pullicola]|nr:BppU family phage baseplate upper protein [Candidatus Coprocola pullicola]